MKHAVAMTLLGLMVLTASVSAALAWDGNWTHAVSGDEGPFYDPGDSTGKAGTDERPQTFFIPPVRDFWDVDPEEFSDYKTKEYTPYALVRVVQDIQYNGLAIPKGYYQVKPGGVNAGSPRVNLKSQAATQSLPVAAEVTNPPGGHPVAVRHPREAMVPVALPEATTPQSQPQPAVLQPVSPPPPVQPATPATPAASQEEASAHKVFVLKKLGRVVAVLPIHRMEPFEPPKGTKVSKKAALAWIEMENRHPVLKFYYKKRLYSTDLQ